MCLGDCPMDLKSAITSATVTLPVVNEVSNNGVITALKLEETIMLGMTYGAWFKLGMGLALILLLVERVLSIRQKVHS